MNREEFRAVVEARMRARCADDHPSTDDAAEVAADLYAEIISCPFCTRPIANTECKHYLSGEMMAAGLP